MFKMNDWQKFFLVRLPTAALVIGIVAEVVAYGLSGVTLHRHNVDDLAAAVVSDPQNYPVVIVGDSTTHNVVHKYRIAGPGQVADLTTHFAAGPPTSMFLLRRMLESGHRPKLVIFAASVHTLTEPMDHGQFDTYLTSVWTRPWEKDFLVRNYPGYVNYQWRPAALNMTTRIGAAAISAVRHPSQSIWSSPVVASNHPVLERFQDEEPVTGRLELMINICTGILLPENSAVIEEFGKLSVQYGFQLVIVWPPMYPRLHQEISTSGKLASLQRAVNERMERVGARILFVDANSWHTYPYFDHDLIHIRGEGWEQVYANDLTEFIGKSLSGNLAKLDDGEKGSRL